MLKLSPIRRIAAVAVASAGCVLAAGGPAGADTASRYVPGVVVVGYSAPPSTALSKDIGTRTGARESGSNDQEVDVLRIPGGESVTTAAARMRRLPGVAYAVPDYIAHATAGWFPNDPGRLGVAGDWRLLQWNFLAGTGVDAPLAWGHLLRNGAPGGRGVTVAILDTGVAFKNWRRFRKSPDFSGTRFVAPCDLISGRVTGLGRRGRIMARSRCTNPNALDRQGHGTFVAGIVAEATNNGKGVTGLAYGASIMPVRVLDAQGDGDSATIARGIRYAATHGARVINLSLEFDLTIAAGDIPDVLSAIRFAHRHGAVVVAAAGNDSSQEVAYPARASDVVSVGATTRDGCLASYSNIGSGLDLVAPGGGDDSPLLDDPNCHPHRVLPDIFQMTFTDPTNPVHFGLPGGWYGTSMAAPHVSGAAALVIASGVLGRTPTPNEVLARLEQTAQALGQGHPNADYGFGLVDAGAATAGVKRVARPRNAA